MKILMVNKFLYPNGGSETYIFELGRQLQAMGHEVQYFGMEHEGRCVGNRVNAYTSDMDFHGGSKLAKLTYPLKTIYSGEARRKIRLVLDDFQPDVVHLNNFNYQLTPSILLEIDKWRRESGHACRILYTAHDYQLVCPAHLFYQDGHTCEACIGGHFTHCISKRCIHGSMAKSVVGCAEALFWHAKKTYKLIDTIICCSAFMKRKLDTDAVLAGKTVVMHNFIAHIERLKAVNKENYVLYFGRFSKEKGVETLMEAARRLNDIPFVFAGSGELAEKLNTIPNARYIGFKSGAELGRWIEQAAISVCPSEWYENCPFSVMESIAHGTPVIGASIGGIPELIEDGKNGLLFESGNADDLCAKIRMFWDDKARLKACTEGCRAEAFDTVEEYAQKLMTYYGK